MKFTLKQVMSIVKPLDKARDALKEAETAIIQLLGEHQGNEAETLRVLELLQKLDEISLPIGLKPQSEWTGGDSSDPKNYKLREGYFFGNGSARRYYTAEELEEAEAVCNGLCVWNV